MGVDGGVGADLLALTAPVVVGGRNVASAWELASKDDGLEARHESG